VFTFQITSLTISLFPSSSSLVPKSRLVEGSEFLNEQDSAKVGLVSGLNGNKPNQWSFEKLIDLNVHSKVLPLIKAEDCNQVLINCDGSSDGTRVAFEDKGTPVNTQHSSHQPIEALSGEDPLALNHFMVLIHGAYLYASYSWYLFMVLICMVLIHGTFWHLLKDRNSFLLFL